jgi:hypothetical protein
MKIKMKIAYSALEHGQPIIDFFINAIIKAFIEFSINDHPHFMLDDNQYFKWRRAFRGEGTLDIDSSQISPNTNKSQVSKPFNVQVQNMDPSSLGNS